MCFKYGKPEVGNDLGLFHVWRAHTGLSGKDGLLLSPRQHFSRYERRKMRRVVVICFILMSLAEVTRGDTRQQNVIVLDPIFVSPLRTSELESRTAASVDLIDHEDIANSHAGTTIDLFRSRPGIMVRDWTGNGTSAQVDIRGFGEQSGMNTAVLIDGKKMNEVDLSAMDWTKIPLSRISRIEIIRGGSGAVLFGDNASSGVINIITKKGEGEPFLEYEQQYGSYDMHSERVNIGGYIKKLSYYITCGNELTHGYRNNSYFENQDISSNLRYDVDGSTRVKFSQSWHKTEYGLPGAISSADLEAHDRRFSDFGDDYVKRIDYDFSGGFEKELWGWGELSSDFFFRRKDSYTNFVGANAGWNPILRSRIDTFAMTPQYVLDRQILGNDNKFITGIDFYRWDFNSNNYASSGTIQNLTAINKTTLAWYGQDSLTLFDRLTFTGGYRYETADYDFDYVDLAVFFPNPPVDDGTKKIAHAYNAGAVLEYSEGCEAFLSFNQSYRLPAVDEYFTWGTLNLGFSEQESENYECGIRHRVSDDIKCGISFFRMNVDNEIYYNPTGGPGGFGSNENYDKTVHQGFEVSTEIYPVGWAQFHANYNFTDAYFDGDEYSGKQIPMVPRNKASAGCRFFLPGDLTLNVTGTFVGERYFINDQANRFEPLKRYFTLDANVFYKMRRLTLGVGVNNILNEKYYEYGVRNATTGAVNYYPAAGTNFYVEGRIRF